MATLKDLIKTETLKVGSHGASPSESGVIVLSDGTSIGNWGSIYSGVAPTDGFVAVNAKSANTAAACVIDNAKGYSVGKLWGKAGAKIGLTLPFARGTKISVNGNDLSEITVRFIKTIGGGYKRYLKALSCNRFGGSLWLRLKTTSETLRRPGVASRSRVGKLLNSNLSVRPREMGTELTSHLLTGILPYGLMQRPMFLPKPFRATAASSCQRILQRSGLGALSLAGRGKSVNTPCTVMGSFKEGRCSFIPRVACNNARMEVAA